MRKFWVSLTRWRLSATSKQKWSTRYLINIHEFCAWIQTYWAVLATDWSIWVMWSQKCSVCWFYSAGLHSALLIWRGWTSFQNLSKTPFIVTFLAIFLLIRDPQMTRAGSCCFHCCFGFSFLVNLDFTARYPQCR